MTRLCVANVAHLIIVGWVVVVCLTILIVLS